MGRFATSSFRAIGNLSRWLFASRNQPPVVNLTIVYDEPIDPDELARKIRFEIGRS
jgi:hypothetical protein